MYKHANKTCACAVDPDARSQLQFPTDAAAPGRAFPASRQALQAQQRHRAVAVAFFGGTFALLILNLKNRSETLRRFLILPAAGRGS